MTLLFVDLETYSEADLKDCGAYAYAEHPSTRIDLLAFALDDGEVEVHEGVPPRFIALYLDPKITIVAHNSHFENALLTFCAGLPLLTSDRWWDTMAIANSLAYPASLAGLCERLGVDSDVAKDKDGKALVALFCKPGRGGAVATSETHPEEWERYREYVRRDVTALREVFRLIPKANCDRPEYAREWDVDWQMNTTGVLCDLEFCEKMLPLVEQRGRYVNVRLATLTEGRVTSVGQVARLVKETGLPNMQRDTVEAALLSDDLSDPVREVLSLRAEAGKAAVKKYVGFINRANLDGRLRGFMVLYGASRTGRYSSKGVQLHNLVKPTLKWPEIVESIDFVLRGGVPPVTDVFEIASSALRSVILPDPMHMLLVTDLAQIEARVLAYLAGQLDALEVFASGKDIYTATASKMFHIPYDNITPDQRFVGKTAVLALGFGQWISGFCGFCEKMGIPMDEARAIDIVVPWRDANPRIVTYWKAVENAARSAIYNPGQKVVVRDKVSLQVQKKDLHITLPSGRALVYPRAFIKDGDISFSGAHHVETTYGGKLTENITQAVARDIMAENLPLMSAAGYPILLTVHDEVISQKRILDTTRSVEALSALLATRPSWAPDLPLKATGFTTERYRK